MSGTAVNGRGLPTKPGRQQLKNVTRWIAALVGAAMLAACASYIPSDSTAASMSVKEARQVITAALKHYGYAEVRFTARGLVASGMVDRGIKFRPTRVSFDENTRIIQEGSNENLITVPGQTQFLIFGNPRAFADALHVLKQNGIKSKMAADEFAQTFAASLDDYRRTVAAGTPIPEDANRYRVQAEGAVRDKQFIDAADYFGAALQVAPWWPAGHFNRALVLGEAGDYEAAQREMVYYLKLLPDAANARAAQDKIYDWERLQAAPE